MTSANDYLAQAAKYIGIGGDQNQFNYWYWVTLNGYSYDPGWAWCACFQSYVGVHDLGMDFTPSASAAGVANQGTRVPDEQAQAGDWVLFNWDGRQTWDWADHIGVVEWSDITGSGYFGTIEGNCDDMVKRCTRYNYGSYGTAFFRPPYSNAPAPQPATSWPVQLYEPNTTDAQKWKLNKQSDGSYEIVSVANGMALDVYAAGAESETKVWAYKRNDTKAQRWVLARQTIAPCKAKYNPPEWAPFTLSPLCAPALKLDVRGASKENGAAIQIYKANGTNAQNWYPMDNGDGTFTFVNVGSGYVLDVKGGGK